jgi:hypothetical protein
MILDNLYLWGVQTYPTFLKNFGASVLNHVISCYIKFVKKDNISNMTFFLKEAAAELTALALLTNDC